MYRKLFCAVLVAGITGGVALAQTTTPQLPPQPPGKQPGPQTPLLRGKIVRVNNNTVYFQAWNPETRKYEIVKQYRVDPDDFRVWRMNGKNREALREGLRADIFTNRGNQGLYGTLQLQGNRLSGITLMDQAAMQGLPAVPGSGVGGTPNVGGRPGTGGTSGIGGAGVGGSSGSGG